MKVMKDATRTCLHYTRLDIVSSVTYHLQLLDAIFTFVLCISHVLLTNVELVVWTLQNGDNCNW